MKIMPIHLSKTQVLGFPISLGATMLIPVPLTSAWPSDLPIISFLGMITEQKLPLPPSLRKCTSLSLHFVLHTGKFTGQ